MKTIHTCLVGMLLLGASAHSEPPARPSTTKPPDQARFEDPRTAPRAILLYRDGADHTYRATSHALLIFARDNAERPNTIIGVDGSFTDEQIITALKRFYREWQPPKENPDIERPAIILAKQGWGSGAALYSTLKSLSAEFKLDVYQHDGVHTQFEVRAYHPTPNDKRLSELIQLAQSNTPKVPPK